MSIEALLKEAILKLPIKAQSHELIPSIINDFILIAGLASINDKPNNRECSSYQAQNELDKLITLCTKLSRHILKMHKTSIDTLVVKNVVHPLLLEYDLKNLITQSEQSKEHLSTLNTVVKGASKKRQAASVMKYIAKSYKQLTGLEGSTTVDPHDGNKAKGIFLEYTANIYSILGIKVSAESQIKSYKANTSK